MNALAGKKHKVQGLRRRWLTGSMGPVLVILLLVGVLISVGFASNYYNSARSTLRAKAAAGADYFNTYVMTSYREYYRSATVILWQKLNDAISGVVDTVTLQDLMEWHCDRCGNHYVI